MQCFDASEITPEQTEISETRRMLPGRLWNGPYKHRESSNAVVNNIMII